MAASETKKPHSMAFYHSDGLVPAWNLAQKFVEKKGKIATLQDIIENRIKTDQFSTSWTRYFTTTSAEYVGLSRGGNPIAIVAHGVGPMSTLDGILRVYSHEYKDKERRKRGGRITQQEFLNLEDGLYGDVRVVDLDYIHRRYEYPFLEILRLDESLRDSLLLARLGDNATEYLMRHAEVARAWHARQAKIVPENTSKMREQDWRDFVNRRELKHRIMSRENSNPYMIQLSEASNCIYGYHDLRQSVKPCPWVWLIDKDYPFAHLLSIGSMSGMHHEGRNESLTTQVTCHEWNDGVRFAAMRHAANFDIHPGPEDLSSIIWSNWELLMKPVKNPIDPNSRFWTLMGDKNLWFTMVGKSGHGMDSYEPEFHVAAARPIGKPVTVQTDIGGYHGIFRYDTKEVKAKAIPGTNAYALYGEPEILWKSGNPVYHEFQVQFYIVDVDTSQRLAKTSELKDDFEALMRLLGNLDKD